MMESRSHFLSRSSDDQRVLEILEQFLVEQEQGNNPDREKVIAENPDLESRLRDCFESMAAVESLAGGMDSVSSASSPEKIVPDLEDYRVIRELGRGGMGVVYEAEQISLSRRVALKVLPLAAVFDQKSLQRFKNEALATAQLEHANIINVYSVGFEKGIHYYSMQLVEGQSLSQVIRSLRGIEPDSPQAHEALSHVNRGSVPAAEEKLETVSDSVTRHHDSISSALSVQRSGRRTDFYRAIARIGCQAASALHHAHQMGIVHRDIKPSNLLLDVRGDILVSDFGLATMQGEINVTATGDLLGTLKYMSPEQASGQQELIDSRTDVYSLGATLYELMTCRSVIEGKGRKQVLKKILEESITPPSKINRTVPQDLETIVMKALSHEREARYATSGQMAEDLQRYLDDQPIKARRPTLNQRSAKWLRRNRWVASTVAAFLLLLVSGSIASSVTIYRWYDTATIALARANEAEQELKDTNEKLIQAVAIKNSTEEEIKRHARSYLEKAKWYFDKRQYNEAVTYFQSTLQLNEQSIESHLWLARCQAKLHDVDKTRYHATICITKLEAMAESERSEMQFQEWEPYYERAVAGIAKQMPNTIPLAAAKEFRAWDQSTLELALSDATTADAKASDNLKVQIIKLQAGFDLAVQTSNVKLLREVSDDALELLRKHTSEREVIEVAMIASWKLGRFEIFSQLNSQHLEGQKLATHGNIYLLKSLAHYQSGDSELGFESFGRGLRWFLSRGVMNFHHERFVRNWLVETAAAKANRKFNAWEDPESWTSLLRFRIDSSALLATATAQPYDALILQNEMNETNGAFWTPDYKAFGHPQNGVQLFWQPASTDNPAITENPRLKFALFDTNVIGPKLWSNGVPYNALNFKPGKFRLTANLTSSNDFAIVQFWWNGKRVGEPIDLYQPKPSQLGESDFGWVEVVEGANVMEIEVVGRNSLAISTPAFGMDFVDLWPEGYSPGRTPSSDLYRRVSDRARNASQVISKLLESTDK